MRIVIGLGLVMVLSLSMAACKALTKKDEGSGAAPAVSAPVVTALPSVATPPVASASATATASAGAASREYSTEGLRAIADNCIAPLVILTAVPHSVFDAKGFRWRFASQVVAANLQFHYPPPFVDAKGPGVIRFTSVEHTATKGVALVARCTDAKSCTQFASAYRTVVPTSKPELFCGKAPTLGAEVEGPSILNFDVGDIIGGTLPTADDVVGQCVRLAACRAERDRKLDGDPAIACQKRPSTFKLACAAKTSCADVLRCLE